MFQHWFSLITLLTGIMVWGCGGGDPDRRIVTIYSPHGKPILPEFEKLFESAYPKVDIRWLDMGSQDVLDRVRSERANPQGDVWWGAPATNFIQAADEGLLSPYRPTWADALPPEFRDDKDRWYGTAQLLPVIAFNNLELTRETAPKDWDELLDPRWRDLIIIRYPLASGTMRTVYSGMIWRSYQHSGSPDVGYNWLRRLDANTKDYAADPNMMFQKLARKEGLVSIWLMSDIMLQVERYGYPFLTDGIALIANGKNAEDARLFIEFVTNIDNTILQAKEYYRIPTRGDIPKDLLPAWMANISVAPFDINWKVFSQQSKTWMKYWDDNIKDRG